MSESDECRVDMHVKILDERVISRAKSRGIDALVYAPHFTRLPEIESRAAAFSDDELTVVPAREIFTGTWRNRIHVLGIGLSEPVPDFITLEGAMEELDRQDAAVLVPHPEFLNVSFGESELRRYRARIDAVETYNPKYWPHHYRRAKERSEQFHLPPFASSYAHRHATVGEVWTAFDGDLADESGLIEAIKTATPRRLVHRNGVRHGLRCVAEFAHLGWENSWGKIDRLFLSGTEPTHPDHVAYGGRFDAVAVY